MVREHASKDGRRAALAEVGGLARRVLGPAAEDDGRRRDRLAELRAEGEVGGLCAGDPRAPRPQSGPRRSPPPSAGEDFARHGDRETGVRPPSRMARAPSHHAVSSRAHRRQRGVQGPGPGGPGHRRDEACPHPLLVEAEPDLQAEADWRRRRRGTAPTRAGANRPRVPSGRTRSGGTGASPPPSRRTVTAVSGVPFSTTLAVATWSPARASRARSVHGGQPATSGGPR